MIETANIEAIRKQLAGICSDLSFDEALHHYTIDDQELQPVTLKVSTYAESFRKLEVARAYAKKLSKQSTIPVTAEEVLRTWDKERDAAALKGKKLHSFIEHYPTLTREPDCEEEYGAINWLKELHPCYIPLLSEKMIYSRHKGVAGTMDKLFYNSSNDTLVICDWKTNKDLHKNFQGKTLKPPFQHLLDMPLSKYYLQLNLYRQMLEEHTDLKVSAMWIVHLHKDYPSFFKNYEVPPLNVYL